MIFLTSVTGHISFQIFDQFEVHQQTIQNKD